MKLGTFPSGRSGVGSGSLRVEDAPDQGSAFHADPTLSQFGPWRPIPAMAGYRTPIEGLLHAGSGNHPMGTVNGWSGRTAAREYVRGAGRSSK